MPSSLVSRLKRPLLPAYQRQVRRLHELSYLFVELTNDCNLACLHCGSDCTAGSGVPNLPADKVLEVLREIKQKYDPHHISVVLSGGEPLCYPGIFELGAAIKALEFPWGMVTNGYGWDESLLARAGAAGMLAATVSLDGEADTHDWLRGKPGSWERAIRTIGLFAKAGFLQAWDVITCANRRNLAQLPAVAERLAALGVPAWRIFTISPIGRAAGRPDLFLTPEEYRSLLDFIAERRKQPGLALALSESGYLGRCHELAVRDQYFFCRAGVNTAGIMANGDILACPNIDRRFRQGNVFTDSFTGTWENGFQVFRERDWMRTGRCASCPDWNYCQGGAFHLRTPGDPETKFCQFRDCGLDKGR